MLYIPHGHCYLWQTPLVSLHVLSDGLIALAYFSIPAMLVYFVRKRQDTPFTTVFLLFSLFIAACGVGHLLDIWTLWFPNYWVAGVERALTAFVSCLTAIRLVEWTPQFLALRSPQELETLNQQLQAEVQARKQAQETLQRLVAGTASTTGDAFFTALVQNLAETLNVRYVLVSERVGWVLSAGGEAASEDLSQRLRSLAIWADGAIRENVEVAMPGTPCGQVVQERQAQYYTDLQNPLLTRLLELTQWEIQCYLGVPLLDGQGQALGSLCVVHDRPLKRADEAEAIMAIFAARATAELQRQRAETALRKAYGEMEQRVEERTAALQKANAQLAQVAQREWATSQVINHMRQTLDLGDIFRSMTQELRRAIGCDRVIVYRFNADWSGSVVAEAVGQPWLSLLEPEGPSSVWEENLLNHDRCTVRLIAAHNSTIRDTYMQETQGGMYAQGHDLLAVDDVYARGFSDCYIQLLETLQAKAYMTVPIHVGPKLWGLLACYQNTTSRQWDADEKNMVSRIGLQLGVAIQQANLLAQTQQQAQELEQARDTAIRANAAKSEFLASMSHELRTPLNAILGFTELMHLDDTLSETHKNYVDIINTSGEHLLGLINNVLELSKIEAGQVQLDLTLFDLHRLLQEMYELFQLQMQQKGLTYKIHIASDVPQLICGDVQKLRQVLLNLIGNSLKFTPAGSITCTVTHTHRLLTSDDPLAKPPYVENSPHFLTAIHVSVSDTGVGVAEDELPRLFENFQQTQSGRDLGQGTGLGLPISQQYVRLMGGQISAESQVGQGSTFSFWVPAWAIANPEPSSSLAPRHKILGVAPGQPAPRILIAEDNPMNRRLLRQMLEHVGAEVREAENGEVAIALWETWQPHLIWMDMRMPVMDGYAATRHIRHQEETSERSRTSIIALSATAFEENKPAMLAAGCDDTLAKPFRLEALLNKMQKHLNLEFVYDTSDETSESQPPAGLTASDFAGLAANVVAELRHAALAGDDAKICELSDRFLADKDYLKLGLHQLAERFLFKEIIALLDV